MLSFLTKNKTETLFTLSKLQEADKIKLKNSDIPHQFKSNGNLLIKKIDFPAISDTLKIDISPKTKNTNLSWEYQCIVEGKFEKNSTEYIAIVKKHICQKLKKSVVVHISEGKTHRPIFDDCIHLWLWSAIKNLYKYSRSDYDNYDYNHINHQCFIFHNAGYGKLLPKEAYRVRLVEIYKNNIYYLYCPYKLGTDSELKIFNSLLSEAVEVIQKEDPLAKIRQLSDDQISKNKQLYKKTATQEHQQRIAKVRKTLNTFHCEITDCRNIIVNNGLQLAVAKEKYPEIVSKLEKKKKSISEQAEKLLKNPKVHSVTTQRNTLVIHLCNLQTKHPVTNKMIPIDDIKFTIDNNNIGISTYESNPKVTILNRHYHYAPRATQSIIWDEYSAQVLPELLNQNKIADIIDLAIKVLENNDGDNNYNKIWTTAAYSYS